MDSWIYPALERLAAWLHTRPEYAIRPWTRQECLRQLRLAENLADLKDTYSPACSHKLGLMMADLQY